MDRHACFLQCGQDALLVLVGQRLVQQNHLGCVADGTTASLAVDHQLDGFVNVRGGINIEVAVTRSGFDGGHSSAGDHSVDQASATARDNQIHEATSGDQVLH